VITPSTGHDRGKGCGTRVKNPETSKELRKSVWIATMMSLSCKSNRLVVSLVIQEGAAVFSGRLEDGEWQTVDPVLRDPADIYGKR